MESQNAIVFIDELHTLVGAGSAEGSWTPPTFSSRALPRRNSVHRRTRPANIASPSKRPLPRAPLQSVKVPAPNEEEAVQVISGVRERYEKFHAVSYTDDALSIGLSFEPLHSRSLLPDKAIDLIDEAGARVKLRQASVPKKSAKCKSA